MPAMTLEYARKHRDKLRKELLEIAARQRDIANRGASGEEISAQEEAEYFRLKKRAEQHKTDLEYALLDVQEGERLLEDEEAIRLTNERAGIGKGTGNMSNVEVRHGMPLPEGGRFADLEEAEKAGGLAEFGSYCRALLMGEQRSQYEGDNASGGYLVPLKYGAAVLDLAVNEMQVRKAGARIVPMDSRSMQIARIESDPIPSWRAENAAIAEASGVFSAVTLTAKSLSVDTRLSLELMEDSEENMGNVIGSALARSFALEADRVALYGSGSSNQPRGLKNTTGVNIVNYVGSNGGVVDDTNGDYAGFIAAVGRLKRRNYTPSGLLYSPRTETSFAVLTDTTGQPLSMPDYLKEIPRYVTGQIPDNLTVGTSTDTSDFFAGDWSKVLIGVRTQFKIMPINEYYLVSNGQIGLAGGSAWTFRFSDGCLSVLAAVRA